MEWHKNDDLFKQELRNGYRWQVKVARHIEQHGLPVQVPALEIRGHISDRHRFADVPDIICCKKILEVKSRNLKFTCPEDYPFSTVLIETVDGWDDKEHRPHAYVCVSTVTGAMIALSSTTYQSWSITKNHDRVRDIDVESYECPRGLWKPIDALIEALKADWRNGSASGLHPAGGGSTPSSVTKMEVSLDDYFP